MDTAPPAFDDIDAAPDVCTAAWMAVLLPRLHRYLPGGRIELVRHLGPVSRAWYFAAARAHYHDVTVPSRSKLAALLDCWQPSSADTSSVPALGSFVRTLRVADIKEPSFVTSSDPVNDDWLGQLAVICPNVTKLELDRVQVLSDECLDTLATRFAPAAAVSSKFTGKFSKGKNASASTSDPQRPFAQLEALSLRRCPNLTPRGTRLLLQLLGAIDSRCAWPPNPHITLLAVVECEYALDHALLVAILHGPNDTPTSSTALPSYQDAVASTLSQWTHLELSGMTVLFNDPACIDALITAAMAYRLSSLQSLHMAGARIRHPHALPSLLRALPPLTDLDLANTFVPSFPPDESVWATHAPSLTRLNIAGVSAAQRTDRAALAYLLTHVLTTLRDLVLTYTDDVDDDGTAAGDVGLPVPAAQLALTRVERLTVHVRAGPNPCGGLPTQLARGRRGRRGKETKQDNASANGEPAAAATVAAEAKPPVMTLHDLVHTRPADFPPAEWHSGRLAAGITLGGQQHSVSFHIHRTTGVAWAHLAYSSPNAVPPEYWFRITDWANTTGLFRTRNPQPTEWRSGHLAAGITLGGVVHSVTYHIHRTTGLTWAYLRHIRGLIPSGYWYCITDWANTTGATHDALITSVPEEQRHMVAHWAFESAYDHVGIPQRFSTKEPGLLMDFGVFGKKQLKRFNTLAVKYGEYDSCNPIGLCCATVNCMLVPIRTELQRIAMIEYSLVHVFGWIEHLWKQYPALAPAIALSHAVGEKSGWELQYGFMEQEETKSKCFQDGGRFRQKFDPKIVMLGVQPDPLVGQGLADDDD
ncbi:hypothetical protein GGF32_002426 [Allomyces javanicus]|nr:hypothetical protein GGF32_002426 [Allomyces javanicus]